MLPPAPRSPVLYMIPKAPKAPTIVKCDCEFSGWGKCGKLTRATVRPQGGKKHAMDCAARDRRRRVHDG